MDLNYWYVCRQKVLQPFTVQPYSTCRHTQTHKHKCTPVVLLLLLWAAAAVDVFVMLLEPVYKYCWSIIITDERKQAYKMWGFLCVCIGNWKDAITFGAFMEWFGNADGYVRLERQFMFDSLPPKEIFLSQINVSISYHYSIIWNWSNSLLYWAGTSQTSAYPINCNHPNELKISLTLH